MYMFNMHDLVWLFSDLKKNPRSWSSERAAHTSVDPVGRGSVYTSPVFLAISFNKCSLYDSLLAISCCLPICLIPSPSNCHMRTLLGRPETRLAQITFTLIVQLYIFVVFIYLRCYIIVCPDPSGRSWRTWSWNLRFCSSQTLWNPESHLGDSPKIWPGPSWSQWEILADLALLLETVSLQMSTMSFDTFELLLHWFRVIFVVSDPSLDFPLFVLLLICFMDVRLLLHYRLSWSQWEILADLELPLTVVSRVSRTWRRRPGRSVRSVGISVRSSVSVSVSTSTSMSISVFVLLLVLVVLVLVLVSSVINIIIDINININSNNNNDNNDKKTLLLLLLSLLSLSLSSAASRGPGARRAADIFRYHMGMSLTGVVSYTQLLSLSLLLSLWLLSIAIIIDSYCY